MRLFFALWPPDAARAKLARVGEGLAREAQGRPIPAAKLHVTLAFLGEVTADRLEAAREAAARSPGAGFRIAIDRIGSFRDAHIAWAGCSETPTALIDLQARLAAELRAAAFGLEERRFTAHVTLVRRAARPVPPAAVPAITWTARDFALVRSDTGRGTYTVMEEWRLGSR